MPSAKPRGCWRFFALKRAISLIRIEMLAEREGFEPSIRFWRILTFQASAFDHSATAPHALEGQRPSLGRAEAQALALTWQNA